MTLKRIEIESLRKIRDEFQKLADSLNATAQLTDEQDMDLQSNQLGNLNEGLKRVKKFVVDIDNRFREALFHKETPPKRGHVFR